MSKQKKPQVTHKETAKAVTGVKKLGTDLALGKEQVTRLFRNRGILESQANPSKRPT